MTKINVGFNILNEKGNLLFSDYRSSSYEGQIFHDVVQNIMSDLSEMGGSPEIKPGYTIQFIDLDEKSNIGDVVDVAVIQYEMGDTNDIKEFEFLRGKVGHGNKLNQLMVEGSYNSEAFGYYNEESLTINSVSSSEIHKFIKDVIDGNIKERENKIYTYCGLTIYIGYEVFA